MIPWPNSLPAALQVDGFADTLGQGAIRTEVDAGPAFQRPRYTATTEPINGTLLVDTAQYATLVAFWRDGTRSGALPFAWVHPITGAPATVRFNASKPPKITAKAGTWFRVALTLEVLP